MIELTAEQIRRLTNDLHTTQQTATEYARKVEHCEEPKEVNKNRAEYYAGELQGIRKIFESLGVSKFFFEAAPVTIDTD